MGDIISTSPLMKFKYVAPASPPDLLECTSFTIDFPNRKFLHVGIDPTQQFAKVILIITPARHIVFPVDFLHRIFQLMGNILSFLLNTPTYKKNIFLCTEVATLNNMVYKGENTLVIESKTQEGCRVLLNRSDLMRLLDLESSIMQLISSTEDASKVSITFIFSITVYIYINTLTYFRFLILNHQHHHHRHRLVIHQCRPLGIHHHHHHHRLVIHQYHMAIHQCRPLDIYHTYTKIVDSTFVDRTT